MVLNINDNCGSTSWKHLSSIVKEDGYDLGIPCLMEMQIDVCFSDSQGNLIDGDALIAG